VRQAGAGTRDRAPFAVVPIGANTVSLLVDGIQAFPAMLAAIASARSSIGLETYILRDDGTGWRFARALAERARAGVDVRIVYDAWGSSVGEDYLDYLRTAGAHVVAFHPIRLAG
jgi:cardiolipin synthase